MGEAPTFKYVSRKRRVREDRRFVSGQATYVSDVTPPGTRHAAVLTSPYACARIVRSMPPRRWPCRDPAVSRAASWRRRPIRC
jgi:hypothetical protein